MDSCRNDIVLPMPGCPIRKSPDQSLLSGSPKLIAASHALRRLLAPRHSPCALNSLTTMQEHPCACTRRLPVHTIQFSKNSSDLASLARLEAYFPKGPRSRHLGKQASFAAIKSMELMGIEPTTPGLQSRCSPS